MIWKTLAFGIAGLTAGAVAFVRLTPVDVAPYHVPPAPPAAGESDTINSFTTARTIATPPEDLLRVLRSMAVEQPRTRLVAGSVEDNLMTFETRSALMGYPDMTTVTVTEGDVPLLVVHAQSVYGKGDMGVNKARVRDWLARLGPLVGPAP